MVQMNELDSDEEDRKKGDDLEKSSPPSPTALRGSTEHAGQRMCDV